MPEHRPRLIVLPPSHYCERARWALDHVGMAYTEERWAVGVHIPLARRLAPSTALPILDTGSEVIQGSDRILDWVGLPGADPELERRFERRIAVLVRQYIYAATLSDPRSGVRALLFDGVPAWQAVLGRLAWPATRRLMVAVMKASPGLVPKLERDVDAELAWFDERLDGRRYLAGDRFGRADITAASLLAPLARPPACPLYRRIALPPNVESALAKWRARPSLRWVERTYAEHRSTNEPALAA